MRHVPHHRHPANPYASGPLDRADCMRADTRAISAALAAPNARLVPVWRGLNLVRFGKTLSEYMPKAGETDLLALASETVFLGFDRDRIAHFALDLSDHPIPPEIAPDAGFEDLRKIGPVLEDDPGAVMAYARGLVHWHRRHRFCGVCGSPTQSGKAGHERRCVNPDCNTAHFPRTDPAVIMLVHDGDGRIVLGRQPNWRPGMHSVLAGFVEPGESLEDAVAREVYEEVGLDVTNIDYRSSQPWPFPSSIMLGFVARAVGTDLTPATDEIESARWVSRDEILTSPENETFHLPSQDSIARRLIHGWLEETTS